MAGAQQDGVEGFFRGIGRGIMGLITKPALGVIDSVAMACDAVRRAVDLGHEASLKSCNLLVISFLKCFFPALYVCSMVIEV